MCNTVTEGDDSWTTRHSVLLTRLLDNVIGTQKMMEIRKNHCKMDDSIMAVGDGKTSTSRVVSKEGLGFSRK